MTTQLRNYSFFIVLILVLSSCGKDDPVIPNEEEVITTLRYSLMPEGGGIPVVFSFQDLDGDGGNAPVITTGNLLSNKVYSATLDLLNEQSIPSESITEEIRDEAEEHQFFFQSTVSGLSIEYDDQDADGNPIGINSTLVTSGIGGGTITIILRHEPNKSANGVADGDISNAGGETDIEVTFSVSVQ